MAHVGCMRDVAEWPTRLLDKVGAADTGDGGTMQAWVAEMLRGCHQLEELHSSRGPTRHAACQVFQQRNRALAASVVDGVCHFAPGDQDSVEACALSGISIPRLTCAMHRIVSYQ